LILILDNAAYHHVRDARYIDPTWWQNSEQNFNSFSRATPSIKGADCVNFSTHLSSLSFSPLCTLRLFNQSS
jgi:hypothetical protein